MEQVHVVTGGFYGVGDVIGRSYHEKRHQMGRPSNIWHILPVRDNQVRYLAITFWCGMWFHCSRKTFFLSKIMCVLKCCLLFGEICIFIDLCD